jgi:hypothetical protein
MPPHHLGVGESCDILVGAIADHQRNAPICESGLLVQKKKT